MSRLALAAAAVAFLVLPAPALAQGYYGPFQPRTEDYGPGITVSGAGFAPLGHRDRAVARAVGDPETGEFHVIRRKPVRRCYKPRVAVRLDLTYLAG